MKIQPARRERFLLFVLLLLIPVAAPAQQQFNYTNNDGIWIYTTNGSTANLLKYENTVAATAVAIPATFSSKPVISIGESAFSPASAGALVSVSIPDTVSSIGDSAFLNSTVTSVLIPDNVTNIGSYAFENSSLTGVTIPGSVLTIGLSAFQSCTNLTNVVFNLGLTKIGTNMFDRCTALTNGIVIPDSVISIGPFAFFNTVFTNVLIAGSVATIGEEAFGECYNLRSVQFLGNAPVSDPTVYISDRNLTNYYQSFTIGWTNSYAGFPAIAWVPPVPSLAITTYGKQTLLLFPVTVIGTNFVVRMSTNPASGNWVVVTNDTLFTGVQFTNPPANAFYQLQ